MNLTHNQWVVLAVLAGAEGGVTAAEVAARSGRRYVPGVVRVLESLRPEGLVSPLDGQAARRWRITEAGQSALTRHRRIRSLTPSTARVVGRRGRPPAH